MRRLLVFLAVQLTAPLAIAANDITAADRNALQSLLTELSQLTAIDLGNCDHEYPEFATGYERLLESKQSQQLHRLVEHYKLESAPPDSVEHNPALTQCMDVLSKAKRIYDENATFITKLADRLPAGDSSDEP